MKKFNMGTIVQSMGTIDKLSEGDILMALDLHCHGEWGNVCEDSAKLNDEAIEHEGDINKQEDVLSIYKSTEGLEFWVKTVRDRSYTTIYFPEED